MGFWDTAARVGLGVATGGTSELAIRGIGALKKAGKGPDSPDFQGIAAQQAQANRPDQNTPYAATSWAKPEFTEPPPKSGNLADIIAWSRRKQEFEANAPPVQNTDFVGPLKDANEALMGQLGGLSQPMDWSQFGQMGDGDAAREQAIQASYGQATKRLDPMFAQREDQMRTQLINQGLDPNSQAFRAAMTDLSGQRNDAYSNAMNSAIMQGQAAGDSVFRNNLNARQQAIMEALTQRGQPMGELKGLQGFLAMPGFNQSNDMLQAAGMQAEYDLGKYQARNQFYTDIVKGGVGLAQAGAGGGR